MAASSRKPQHGAIPSKEDVLRFIRDASTPSSRREIARAFGIRGADRAGLRALLKEMAEEGLIDRGHRRKYAKPGQLPAVAVLEIYEADEDGTLYGRPVSQPRDEVPPRITFAPERLAGPALGIGDRVLARLKATDDGYEARTIRRLAAAPARIVGVYREVDGGGRITSASRRERYDYTVPRSEAGGARSGDLVSAEVLPGRRLGLREARVVERLGAPTDARAASLIAIHTHDIPDQFPDAAIAAAQAARPVVLGDRADLRGVPLITIDGPDARDFDDAIWAAPDDDPQNKGGWRLIVAIADVAHYVRPDSPLDREARKRGNSVYFPDRVVPMLPHELSSDLCSLRPDEDRAVLAVHMRIDRDGDKLEHRFERALMRSAARVIYEDLQHAHDGEPTGFPADLHGDVLAPLYGAWGALMRARTRREPLDLDLPEMQVLLDDDGTVTGIRPRPRYDSHRIVEDFMIAANVCAAETLEQVRQPCMYRVHDEPDREKLRGLHEFLDSLGLKLTLGEVVRPHLFNRILDKARDTAHWEAVNQSILRAQAQAVYSPDNIGHFGLSLRRYAHFTSPIRRYADLLVHRALIRGLRLGAGGLTDDEAANYHDIGEHISNTERRAMAAERDANDRYLAAYMESHVGAEFAGRIGGVSKAGIFVTLSETGADGLVPMRHLPQDYYVLDEARRTLTGDRTGRVFRMGQPVTVRLREAVPLTGGLLLELLDAGDQAPAQAPRRARTGKPPSKGKGKPRGKAAQRRRR